MDILNTKNFWEIVLKKKIFSENNLKWAFKFLNQNGSGKLNSQKILFALTKYEITIEKDINDVDGDGEGEINFDEFKKQIFCNLI